MKKINYSYKTFVKNLTGEQIDFLYKLGLITNRYFKFYKIPTEHISKLEILSLDDSSVIAELMMINIYSLTNTESYYIKDLENKVDVIKKSCTLYANVYRLSHSLFNNMFAYHEFKVDTCCEPIITYMRKINGDVQLLKINENSRMNKNEF